ncbi:MAG: hypothetical protein E6677_02085, partial [Finegoldia magna]|nr:hypothetical protein [Finegoldia magna]
FVRVVHLKICAKYRRFYEEFANVYKHSITNIIDLSSYEKIQVVDCNYSYDFGISTAQPNSGGIFI